MTRRTTVAADADDLAVLAGEARRRGVSLSKVLGEAVAEKADEVRRGRRPRAGFFRGGGQSIAESLDREPPMPASRPFRG